jgi:RHS repeat-associated protein
MPINKSKKYRRLSRRLSAFEQLERREMMVAAIWHNLVFPLDVNGDQPATVDPLDVLTLVNEINAPKFSHPVTRQLPRQQSPAQRTPFLDPDCDGAVSALDVLMVVNYINAFGAGGGGRSPTSGGTYANAACSPQLLEGGDFSTEISRVLHVPSDNKILQVQFEAPVFDTLSQQQIRDAFEIEVVDSAGRPVILPYASDRDASFNWSEGNNATFGSGAWSTAHLAGQNPSVSFDLSGIAAGTEIHVLARLVNNDSDTNTNVLIRGYEFVSTPAGTPGSAAASTFSAIASRSAPIELPKLNDISGNVLAEYGRTSLSGDNNELLTELKLTNIGSQAALAPLIVVLDHFSDLDANAMRPDGILPDGRPFFDLTAQLTGQSLKAGESIRSREIRFLNDSGNRFTYGMKVFGKLNSAPSRFTSEPNATIEAGKDYRYQPAAKDDDGDVISYSVVVGPDAMEVDSRTGIVTWNTQPSDVGTHRVTIRATDPHGLSLEQTFDLQVVASLQNRPPNFITDPVTDAIASSGFEITTVATGAQPAGVSVISGFRGPRLVSINAEDQSVSVHAGQNNDRFDDTTVYSTGEPRPTGAVIDAGYTVDVGLPPFLVSGDRNDVLAMDQGDLNGDGILDLVVMTARVESTQPQGQRNKIEITRMLGDGEGNFGLPTVIASIPTTTFTNSLDQAKLLRIADIDGDSRMDVVALQESPSRLVTIRGLGNGSFEPVVFSTLATPLNDYRLVDLDQDGNLDIVGRTASFVDLGWMRGAGNGTFAPFVRLAAGGGSAGLTTTDHSRPYDFADIDGDGDIDLINKENNGGNTVIWLNDGAENFSVGASLRPPSVAGGAGGFVLYVADFTGDGILDIFTNRANRDNIDLFVGGSTPLSFTYQADGDVFDRAGNLAGSDRPVDIDGDGDLDIIVANNFNFEPTSPQVLVNDGAGRFSRSDYPMADFPGHILASQLTNRDVVRGVMFGDYNRDGVTDFSYMTSSVTASGGYDFNGVGIRLGTRPGEFGATRTIQNLTLNVNDNEVHAADFNLDGKIDLLTLSNARISLGNGDGTFQPSFPATSISAGFDNAVIADFNLDGIPDYVAARAASSSDGRKFYVALGNGDGTFDAALGPVSAGQFYQYTDIRTADFNNDGFLDLIARAGVEDFIDVYLNSPASPGTFTQSFRSVTTVQGINATGYEHTIATGDFDGDGNTDFVTVDQVAGQPQKLQTFSGDGAGNFTVTNESFAYDDAMFSEFNFYYPYVLQSGDVNSDGYLDVVSFGAHGFIIHIGDGNGAFTSVDHYPFERITANRAKGSFLVDFDEDGQLDLVNHSHDETLSIRLGKGDGTFAEPQRVDTMSSGDVLTFADFDNDGHLDMAVVMTFAGNYNNEDVVFYFGTRNGLVDQLAVDLDGDGNEEVLAINDANDRLKIFAGDNLDRLSRRNDLLTGRAPQAVASGDLNGDGRPEIITSNRAGRSISVFSGSLTTGYTSSEILVGSAPIDVLTRDINGDGNTDVLVLDDVANAVWVLNGSASGALSAPVAIALGDKPGKFTVADATGDGQLDAVITLLESNRLMILPSIGVQPASSPIYVPLSDSPSDIQVTDLNADGNPDLATTLPGSNVLSVLYGRGNNQFARAQNISVGDKPTRVTLADADVDGRMDLIVANSGDNTASVIYNRFDPNEVYLYDSDAIDPDNDPLTYSIIDGPGGLIINSQTGALLWAASPDQVGEHTVTIAANDGRGGVATQSFKIDVQPARDNATPLIATEPNTRIGAGETFAYQATALDNDRDTLRYSLINAPAGATIDPTTGKVTWDARADMALSFAPYGSANGANNRGHVEIEAHPSLQPTSLTAEGWYNFTSLPASNQRTNIISSGIATSTGATYSLYNFGNAFLRLEVDYPSPTASFTYSIPFVPSTNRWTHFAVTIDDSNRAAKIYVDGVERGSTTLPSPLVYNPTANALVGDSGLNFTRAIIDNYRLWNVVRTPAEIVEGLSRQYNGDTRLVLDYRFDEPQTLTVRDYSPAGNDGYRRANGLMPVFVPGLAETGSHQFTIGVEDGRGGFDQQSFMLDILPELRGSIRGQAFHDQDGNGMRNGTEPALEGQHLFIDTNGNGYPDPHESQTTTDASGNYQFIGLLPGQYPVKVSPVAGFETPELNPVSVNANINTQVDLAIEQLALSQIRGQLRTEKSDTIAYWKVFADLDLDNKRDENEPMAMSDRDGNFAITGLSAGTYTIRAELPAGWAVATGTNGQNVTLTANAISEGNHFTLEPTNTSVTGGLHFVTTPTLTIEARQTFRYASVAMGIHNESIIYDISLAPDGMSIAPATGLMAWRPTIAQVGEHLVILRATSASGSISLQDFTLTVTAPNTAPTLSSPEPMGASPGFPPNQPQGSIPRFPTAYVNLVYAIDLQAQDAESHAVSFQLLTGPSGATLDTTTGHLRWTPTLSDVGNAAFSIELRDSQNATSIVNVNIPVLDSQPAATPFAISLPRTQVGLGQNYLARIQGRDALDRPLAWSLVTGPTGLLVSSDGTIRWTPGNNDLGAHSIVVRATNVDGTAANSSFTLQVVGRPVNTSPDITSEPTTSTTVGKEYQYDVQVLDNDADPLSFALVNAPAGMSIHPSLGTIRWTPAADQLGESDVSVQVTDPDGATATQEYKLKVSKSGGPPSIRSVPPTEAAIGIGYLYSIVARDAEGDPLTFRLLAAPVGMTIAENTGVISWTPAAEQLGEQDVVIQVSDGIGGAVTQAFRIRVSAGAPNSPPVMNSIAPRFGVVGQTYRYTATATDPEGTEVRYSLGQAPIEMTIDPVTGIVEWTPTQPYVGKSIVTFIATDAGGATAVESFEIDVLAANSQPIIISTAPVDTPAGAVFTYQVLGRDADLDQLTYELTTAPAGATIDSFGKITWPTTPAVIGSHSFVVRVSDPRGGVATQSFTLSVIEDIIPPKVSLIESLGDANRKILPWQGPFVVYARAIDNVAVASLTLTANGQDIPLSAAGTAVFTFEEWAFREINATATATDSNGNVTTKTITFDYDFPEGWSGAGTEDIPTVAITSPTDTAAVFGMVTITGTASHADFAGYKLSYRRIDESTFTQFHESTTAVVNGTLGVWDTSLLINDEYVIRLEAASNAGVVNVVEHNIGLSGELKLGNFRLSFTDMVIPVAGIPIEITRIYDTLQADRKGDFGYGWRLEYRNTDLRVGLRKSGLEDIGIYSPLRPGVKVYLNVPGVGRQGFTFNPEIRVLPGFGGNNLVLGRPRFTPDRGVTSTLSTGTSNYLQVNEQGELFAPGGIPYNPASPDFGGAYVLTDSAGTVFRINGLNGKIENAINEFGQGIAFSDEGIFSTADGMGIRFKRDAGSRILELLVNDQIQYRYSYSSSGSLTTAVNPDGIEQRFVYSPRFENYLVEILGERGESSRLEYDSDGRVLKTIDPNGRETLFDRIPADRIERHSDPLGNTTTYAFDDFGNVLSITYPDGATENHEFDDRGRLIRSLDPMKNVTSIIYNSDNQVTKYTKPDGSFWSASYDSSGDIQAYFDEIGQGERYLTGRNGQPTKILHTNGDSQSVLLRNGVAVQFVDPNESITKLTINSQGLVAQREANNRLVRNSFDGKGNLLKRQVNSIDGSSSEDFNYDASSNLTSHTNALNETSIWEYNEQSKVSAKVDARGNRTQYEYDTSGLLLRTIFPDSTPGSLSDNPVETRAYDAAGRLIAVTDPDGVTNRFELDAKGRIVQRIFDDDTLDPNDNPRAITEYDLADRVIAEVDSLGNRTTYRYNSISQLIETTQPNGGRWTYRYDAAGNVASLVDPLGQETVYKYDGKGNLTHAVYANGETESAIYDGNSQRIERRVGGGEPIRFEYDSNGSLIAVTQSSGDRTAYRTNSIGSILEAPVADEPIAYVYDALQRLISTKLPSGEIEHITYDAGGNIIKRIDFNGIEGVSTFDPNDKLLTQTSENVSWAYEYTKAGRLTKATNRILQSTYTYGYDAKGVLISRSGPGGIVNYTRDVAGNVTIIDNGSHRTAYVYNSLNLISEIDLNGTRIADLRYDLLGQLIEIRYGNGLVDQRTYDARSRLLSVTTLNGDSVISSQKMQYDSRGLLIRIENAGVVGEFKYDKNDRLVSEIYRRNGTEIRVIEHGYLVNGSKSYQFDSLLGNSYFEYDRNGRLVKQATGSDVVTFSYDANGNQLAKLLNGIIVESRRWNTMGQLTDIDVDGDGNIDVSYQYGPEGLRESSLDSRGRTLYQWDFTREIPELIALLPPGSASNQYFVHATDPIFVESEASVFLHSGHQGSLIYQSNMSGMIVATHVYSAYGNSIAQTGVWSGVFAYAGEFLDTLTGDYDLRARRYRPEIGRFISRDTHAFDRSVPVTLNRYIYGNANPNTYIDPKGTFSFSLPELTVAQKISIGVSTTFAAFEFAVAKEKSLGLFVKILIRNLIVDATIGRITGFLPSAFVVTQLRKLGVFAEQSAKSIVNLFARESFEGVGRLAAHEAAQLTAEEATEYIFRRSFIPGAGRAASRAQEFFSGTLWPALRHGNTAGANAALKGFAESYAEAQGGKGVIASMAIILDRVGAAAKLVGGNPDIVQFAFQGKQILNQVYHVL